MRLTADISSVNNPTDVYTISRMLPAQANVWQYRMKRVGDSQERAATEAQLMKVGWGEQTGRILVDEQQELRQARNRSAMGRAQSAARRAERNHH
ncbi:MAG: hypothetical protein ACREFZ_03390 [Acetobacteraceae bacterium]